MSSQKPTSPAAIAVAIYPMITRTLLTFGLCAFLNGCSEELLRSNSSPAYADGYRDGCSSGAARASNLNDAFVRDEQRYLNDPEYARAWRAGDRTCDGESFRTNPNDPMQTIQIDGPQGVYER